MSSAVTSDKHNESWTETDENLVIKNQSDVKEVPESAKIEEMKTTDKEIDVKENDLDTEAVPSTSKPETSQETKNK